MPMSRGRRYDGEPKLNIKKVIATLLVLAVIVMGIMAIIKLANGNTGKTSETKNITNSYLSVYTNQKWGVINSKGDYVIEPKYEEMVLIPDPTNDVFIYQENVNFDTGTYDSKAINSKNEQLFTNYDKVEAIENIDEYGSVFYDTNTLRVSKDGKYGLINFKGKELLSCEYTSIEPIKYIKNSYVTIKDNLRGLVDNNGKIIIENQYADIQALTNKYEDGYIVKNDSSKFGIIGYNQKKILNCDYNEIKHVVGSNMYVVKEGNDLELINSEGLVLLKNTFDDAISIDNSNIIIKSGDNYGVISKSGDTLIKSNYQYLEYLYDNKYIAQKEGKYGIINLFEENVVDFKYTNITYMNKEGFIRANKENGQSDIMNTEFKVMCEGIVSEINETYSFIKLRVNGQDKYYNFKLEEKTSQEVYPANTLYLSKENGKYGFVNKNGVVVVDYIYEDATEQNTYGYAAVKKNGKWGAIDSTGVVVVEPTLELMQNTVISFIGKWHLGPDLNANYFTDVIE